MADDVQGGHRVVSMFQLGCNESRCVACPGKRKNKVRSQLPQGAKVDGTALQQQQQLQGTRAPDPMSTSANSLAPGNPTMSATGSGRVKVSLGPGRSLMDWIRLTHANPNLSGVNGRFLEVTYEELMKHNKKDDAWICLKGRVYNVTPYMEYHPGGVDELLKGVGKDATDLFNQVHKWVNFESMLEKCLIGKVVGPAVQVRKSSFPVPRIPFIKKLQWTDTATSEDVPDISEGTSPKPAVSYEWFQDDSTVTITIQSMGDAIIEEDKVVADLSGKTLRIRLRLSKYFYFFHVELQDNVYSSYNVQVKCKLKCLEIQLVKEKNCVSWSSLGSFLADHNKLVPLKNAGRGVGSRLRRLDPLLPCCVVRPPPVSELSPSGLCLVGIVFGKLRRGVVVGGGSSVVRRTATAPPPVAALSFPDTG
ncbi:hypothetical protein HPB51_014482 [Rhipicephalus microplus]|uniref:cytochrome-b5 reductase n=1 Tax=Rhipicephalus microplus TaxID=6941 RepID=A0A9J6DH90_RHIMP|nr:hypothetical protein HPB51_014482 [Rhipicephalus microplus]